MGCPETVRRHLVHLATYTIHVLYILKHLKARINLVDCTYIKAVESQILEPVRTNIDKGHVTLVRFIFMLIWLLGGLQKQ